MKLSEILHLNDGLQAMANRDDMPGSVSYPLAVNAAKIAPHIKAFHDSRTKIMEAHSEKDGDGKPKVENNQYVLTDVQAANAELSDLGDTEEEISLTKIKPEKLEGLNVSVAIMAALLPMIEE